MPKGEIYSPQPPGNMSESDVSGADTAFWPFCAPHAVERSGRQGAIVQTRVVYPDYQRQIRLVLHNGGKEDYV